MTSARTLAERYFESWRAKDFDALRALLADDVEFTGPLGHAEGADECIAGLRGMSTMVTDIDVKVIVADGANVITWFELHTADTEPLPTANWSHVEGGKITRVRATFDPRPLAPPS